MKLVEEKISVPKTARYFVLKPEEVTSVLIVVHGYRQLAENFIKKFESLTEDGVMVVAPEGLHRFYIEGYSGNVGASWMTKEARLDDIADHVKFLDMMISSLDLPEVPIYVLGFSQGGPTVCRWLAASEIEVEKLILHSTVFPNDFLFDENREWLSRLSIYALFGNSDQFASEKTISTKMDWLAEQDVNPTLLRFVGGHEIHLPTLRKALFESA